MPVCRVQRNAREFPALSVEVPTTTDPSRETAVAVPEPSPGSLPSMVGLPSADHITAPVRTG